MWIVFALSASLFTALRDIFVKRYSKTDLSSSAIVFYQYIVATLLIGAYCLATQELTAEKNILPSVIGASTSAALGMVCYYKAIQLSDISLMVPLRSLGPVIMLFLAPLLFHEEITLPGIGGVLLVFLGVVWIGYCRQTGTLFAKFREAKGTLYMAGCVSLFALSSLFEKDGILASSAPLFSALECGLGGLLIGGYLLWKREISTKSFRSELIQVSPLGLIFSCMFLTQCYAMGMGPLSYTLSIKRASIIITVLYGTIFLNEPHRLQRLSGAIVILLGAIIISFS